MGNLGLYPYWQTDNRGTHLFPHDISQASLSARIRGAGERGQGQLCLETFLSSFLKMFVFPIVLH